MKSKRLLFLALGVSAILYGCTKGEPVKIPADAIASVDGEFLRMAHVRAQMPGGMQPDDSAKFVQAYCQKWIDDRLILQVASKEVDMTEIDKLVEEYRRELISSEYRRQMARHADTGVFSDDSLQAYYTDHQKEFTLDRPLVKGVYLKLPDGAEHIKEIKKLYSSTRPQDMDKLEKAALSSAIHYDYFRDRWVDWEQIESRIPYGFTNGGADFLRGGKPLNVNINGFTYLLSVSEYIPAGQTMPFEAARPLIRERLLSQLRRSYNNELMKALYERSIKKGVLKLYNEKD